MYYKPFAGFCQFAPLDKPGRMGIIVDVGGRCDKRSAPLRENFNEPYGSQKPSPARVAVFAFQSLDSYRDRMTQNMNRKHEKHTVTPLQKEVTDRLAMYTASLGRVYTAGGFLSNIGGTHGSRPTGKRIPTPVTRSLARNDSALPRVHSTRCIRSRNRRCSAPVERM